MFKKKEKTRMTQAGGFDAPVDRLTAIMEWPSHHRKIMVVLLVMLGTFTIFCLAPVQEAQAVAPLAIAGIAAGLAALGTIGSAAAGAAGSEWIKGVLVEWCNSTLGGILSNTLNIAGNTVDKESGHITGIFSSFEQLVAPGTALYDDVIVIVHGVFINSVGLVIMCVCLVVGLAKVLQHAGQTEAGVNLWQLFLPFIMFIAGSLLISNSVWLLRLPYDVMCQVADLIANKIPLGGGFSGDAVDPSGAFITTEQVDNFTCGALFFTCLLLTLTWLGSFVVAGLANIILILRGLQLYAFTAMAPISLAFIVSDSTRPMATGFAKRYLAVVISYLMMFLILVMASFALEGVVTGIVSGAAWGNDAASAYEGIYGIQGNCLGLLATTGALGFALFKTGSWSRDLLGI